MAGIALESAAEAGECRLLLLRRQMQEAAREQGAGMAGIERQKMVVSAGASAGRPSSTSVFAELNQASA